MTSATEMVRTVDFMELWASGLGSYYDVVSLHRPAKMRIAIDLSDSQIAVLSELQQRRNVSRAELIREAVAQYVARLEKPAEILVDQWGVPHIYARSPNDAFFVQGFNAARDRLWQMDLWRRRGLGTLSEVLGAQTVERDRAARLFLFRGDLYREW